MTASQPPSQPLPPSGQEDDTEGFESLESAPWEPLTLDEAADSIPDDPDPAESDDPPSRPAVVRVTKAVRLDIQGKVEMILLLLQMTWEMRDDICPRVLDENSEKIAEKITKIICKSPDMMKWFSKGGGYMDWIDLFMAILPVLKVAVSHHVTRSIESPGQVEPDYSRYSAA